MYLVNNAFVLHAVNCSMHCSVVGLFVAKVCRPHVETDGEERHEPSLQ